MPSMHLTSVALVKSRLYSGSSTEPTSVDPLIEQLIAQVSDDIEQRCHRRFLEAETTWYVNGNGTRRMYLPAGPLVSVTSVHEVAYSEDDDGDLVETATAINAGAYLMGGLRSDGCRGPSWLDRLGCAWTEGEKNYKVVATCGFVNDVGLDAQAGGVPRDLVGAATAHVCALFNLRDLDGLTNRTVGEGSRSTIPMASIEAALDRACLPYVLDYAG